MRSRQVLIMILSATILLFFLFSQINGSSNSLASQQLRSAPIHSRFYFDDNAEEQEKFSIVIQTFNRTDILYRLINHYMSVPHLEKIVIVWNNVEEPTPEQEFQKFEPLPVPVIFLKEKINSLNNRFRAYTQVSTEAVLLLDDDVFTSASDVTFTFSVWRQFRDRIVGFVARKHVINENGALSYGGFELLPENAYSLILTGAAFVHRKYMESYVNSLPASIRDLVDEKKNCEDLAFNNMVAQKIKNPPIYVAPKFFKNLDDETSSSFRGLWHRIDHSVVRSHCLNSLRELMGGLFLKYNTMKVVQTQDCEKPRN